MKKLLTVTVATALLGACQQVPQLPQGVQNSYNANQKTYQGVATGAIIGAIAGSLTGDGSTDRRQKAIIGAVTGATVGGGVGQYMDRQEAAMREQLAGSGIDVQRQGDNILLNIPSSITFGVNDASVRPEFQGTLGRVASVLSQYPETTVDIIGHTDSTGDSFYNQQLSERRAQSVGYVLSAQGVPQQRLMIQGRGETQPIADNSSEIGRAQNRRVEIKVRPQQAS